MSDEAPKADYQLTPVERATAELRRFPELLPGAADRLASVWVNQIGHGPPEQRAAKTVELMATGLAKRYVDPEYRPPILENGGAPSPLRATLTRYADRLAPGQVEVLASKLADRTFHQSAPQIAATVVKFLASDDGRKHLAGQSTTWPNPKDTAASTVAPSVRSADGRFAEPPAEKAGPKPPRPLAL